MQAFELGLEIDEQGKLSLPQALLEKLEPGQSVRLLLLLEDDDAWAKASREAFLAGYNEQDAMYDSLD